MHLQPKVKGYLRLFICYLTVVYYVSKGLVTSSIMVMVRCNTASHRNAAKISVDWHSPTCLLVALSRPNNASNLRSLYKSRYDLTAGWLGGARYGVIIYC